jgi:hypothetical protein
MAIRRAVVAFLGSVLILSVLPAAPESGAVSYKVDGKAFSFKDGRLEHYKDDGYVWLIAERAEDVAEPSGPPDETREVTVGVSIQLAKDEKALVGQHEAKSADEMPAHFTWYEIVPTEDGKSKTIKEYMASLDSGDERMVLRLKIDNFGPPGTVVTGTFSGKLCDEDGKLHEVTDGVFSVPLKPAK